MLDQGQKDSILYQSQVTLGDLAYEIALRERTGTPCRELYDRAYFIVAYLQAIQVGSCLTEQEEDKLYRKLRDLSGKFDYPIAPSIANPATFPSIIISPVACCGGGGGGGGSGSSQEVYEYPDIATRDGDLANVETPALCFVKDAQADTLVGTASWAFYYLEDQGANPPSWRLVSTQRSILYISEFPSTLGMPNTVGGLPAGTTVGQLQNRTLSSILDDLLFPTVLPTVGTPVSSDLTEDQPNAVEAGSPGPVILTPSFDQGQIINGDGNPGPALIGPLANLVLAESVNGGAYTNIQTQANLTPYSRTGNIEYGIYRWRGIFTYDPGTGTYTDNKGNSVNNLDSQRAGGTRTELTDQVRAALKVFYGSGHSTDPWVPVTTSTLVRALETGNNAGGPSPGPRGGATLLTGVAGGSLNNTGSVTTFLIPSGRDRIVFAVPAGKTVLVKLRESNNADITASFVKTTFDVEDAGGTLHSYDIYSQSLALTGYLDDVHYDITVS